VTVSVEVVGVGEARARLGLIPGRAALALAKTVGQLGRDARDKVSQKLSGDVLQVRSGRLRGSVTLTISATPEEASATVSAGGSAAPYAVPQEFGVPHP
jgi:hypothetical protein